YCPYSFSCNNCHEPLFQVSRQADCVTTTSVQPLACEKIQGVDHKWAFSEIMLEIPDVDLGDAGNLQLCSEYVKDIYSYLRHLEAIQAIRPHYLEGQEVTGSMRAILIDWLVKVQVHFNLLQETLFMATAILDRFLQDSPVPKNTLQLVGITAMLIASKYEEMYPPTVKEFAYITNQAYTCAEIRNMEMDILRCLQYNLGRPAPIQFLRRASKVGDVEVKVHTLAKYLLELTLLDYDMVHYPPSLIAAATPSLQHYIGYTEESLVPVMVHITKMLVRINNGSLKLMRCEGAPVYSTTSVRGGEVDL
ncbi:hypothetical protein JZ751_016558, partial [Albula glossodonta]